MIHQRRTKLLIRVPSCMGSPGLFFIDMRLYTIVKNYLNSRYGTNWAFYRTINLKVDNE